MCDNIADSRYLIIILLNMDVDLTVLQICHTIKTNYDVLGKLPASHLIFNIYNIITIPRTRVQITGGGNIIQNSMEL